MLSGLYAKLIGLGLIVLVLVGLFAWGHHVGAHGVQAKWDAQKTLDSAATTKAQAQREIAAANQRDSYNDLAAKYKAIVHAQAPSVADSVAAGVHSGAVQLRDNPVCPARAAVPEATARSRAADAAATAALAQRVEDSIAAVRAGDDADRQNAQLRAQVIALQGVLTAERKP